MTIAGAGLTQGTTNNCFIHTMTVASKETACHLVGRICRQPTDKRGNPPQCLSEFDTAFTPFARGHVMALKLGGADISANIVPQYGQWQGNLLGAWCAMENQVSFATTDADVFIVDIEYSNGPFTQTYEYQKGLFDDGDLLFHWTEARIPTRFRVWTVAQDWASGSVSASAYFAADDAGKDAAVGPLIAALPNTRQGFDEKIDAMPQIDRDYWRGKMVYSFVKKEHLIYQREIKSRNVKVGIYNQKLLDARLEQNGAERSSPRTSIKRQGPLLRKEEVPLDLAKWLYNDAVRQEIHDKLKSTPAPAAVKGWNRIELAMFTPQQVEEAVYQR